MATQAYKLAHLPQLGTETAWHTLRCREHSHYGAMLRDTFCPINANPLPPRSSARSVKKEGIVYTRGRRGSKRPGSMIPLNHRVEGEVAINPVRAGVNQSERNSISGTPRTSDREGRGGELTAPTHGQATPRTALSAFGPLGVRNQWKGKEKSKAINSPGYVNSHWRAQIGSDHDEPLGQTGSGDFVAPQYTINSFTSLRLPGRQRTALERCKSISIAAL